MKAILFAGTLVLASLVASGQIHYPGYVINNDGDTITGLIEFREVLLNPTSIRLKKSETDTQVITYGINQLRSVFYSNGTLFERHYVSITMDPVELQYANDLKVPVRFDTVFLRVVQRGATATLFAYEDGLKLRFYIQQPGNDKPLELGFRVVKDGPNYNYKRSYRDMLTMAAESSGKMNDKLRSRIARSQYREASLLPIISELNNMVPSKKEIDSKHGVGFRVGGGLNIGSLGLLRENEYSKNATASIPPGFWLMGAYDIAKNPAVGRVVFRAEALFSTSSAEIRTFDNRFISTKVAIDHSFDIRNIGFGLSAMVNVVNKPEFKTFLSLGIRSNYAISSYEFAVTRTSDMGSTVMTSDAGKPRALWTSIPIKAGVLIRRKFEIGVLYTPAREMQGDETYYVYKLSFIEAGVLYHLVRK